jgi:uncharacterized protein YbaP (TraB family)
MVNLVLATALAVAAPQAPLADPAGMSAAPAMFVVRDADTTVYLFGTFHALDGKADWFRDEVRVAFDQSNELVLETLIPHIAGAHTAVPAPFKPQPEFHPLPVTPSASFLGTTKLAINAGKAQGMSVGHGADMILRQAAELGGKHVEGLETLESQFAMFRRMPAAPLAPAPRPGAAVGESPVDSLSRTMLDMQEAWKHGDQTIFVRMLGQLKTASPTTYRMMFTERNGRWADWINARMQTPGTVFVAVGAGHLAGADSLLVRLAQRGIESTRLN